MVDLVVQDAKNYPIKERFYFAQLNEILDKTEVFMKVLKRDGRKVKFDRNKIIWAVQESFRDVDGEVTSYAIQKAKEIAEKAETHFAEQKLVKIEEIQDFVEASLMATKRKDVAKNYILYRNQRDRVREQNSELLKVIREKLSASNVQNQNANVDERSFGGRKGEADSELNRYIALNELMSEKARCNHVNNRIYTHDLDSYAVGMHNCLSFPLDKVLAEGFNTRQTDVRPAESINTAFQLVAVLFQLQSLQQFGGVSATHLDWTMVPYVRKSFLKHYKDGLHYIESLKKGAEIKIALDKEGAVNISIDNKEIYNHPAAYDYALNMTTRELNQAVEGMYHNLNTLQSRSGNQLPFTSINYGTCTLTEGRMVTKALLEKSIEGVGKIRKTPIFPCGIFQCMKGVNRKPEDPNYDLFRLALKSTAKRLYPNYANVDWSGNAGYDINDPKTYFSTMGKRKLSSCKIF